MLSSLDIGHLLTSISAYLSWHCFPIRPGMDFAIKDNLLKPYFFTSSNRASSSGIVKYRRRQQSSSFQQAQVVTNPNAMKKQSCSNQKMNLCSPKCYVLWHNSLTIWAQICAQNTWMTRSIFTHRHHPNWTAAYHILFLLSIPPTWRIKLNSANHKRR